MSVRPGCAGPGPAARPPAQLPRSTQPDRRRAHGRHPCFNPRHGVPRTGWVRSAPAGCAGRRVVGPPPRAGKGRTSMRGRFVAAAVVTGALAVPATVFAHDLFDHGFGGTAPDFSASTGFNAGGKNAQWDLVTTIPTGNPHSDLDFFNTRTARPTPRSARSPSAATRAASRSSSSPRAARSSCPAAGSGRRST